MRSVGRCMGRVLRHRHSRGAGANTCGRLDGMAWCKVCESRMFAVRSKGRGNQEVAVHVPEILPVVGSGAGCAQVVLLSSLVVSLVGEPQCPLLCELERVACS